MGGATKSRKKVNFQGGIGLPGDLINSQRIQGKSEERETKRKAKINQKKYLRRRDWSQEGLIAWVSGAWNHFQKKGDDEEEGRDRGQKNKRTGSKSGTEI